MKKFLIFIPFLLLFSCVKTRNCECKITWMDYSTGYSEQYEQVVGHPVKGTKQNAKTECDIIRMNYNNVADSYAACTVK